MKSLTKIMLLLVVISVTGNLKGSAQSAGDRIKAKRIAFFTDKLQLTPDEAQKFWPVFNEYNQKKNAIILERRKLTENFQANSARMSDAEVDRTLNRIVQLSQQENQLFEQYNRRFRDILPASKVMKLYIAETEFKVILLKELKANSAD